MLFNLFSIAFQNLFDKKDLYNTLIIIKIQKNLVKNVIHRSLSGVFHNIKQEISTIIVSYFDKSIYINKTNSDTKSFLDIL